jgi:type IV pilus biogenesis protein PilP
MRNNLGCLVIASTLLFSGALWAQSTSADSALGKPQDKAAPDKWVSDKPALDKSASEKSSYDKSASDRSASDRLTQIEAETLLLKAREKQIDVQASIITKQNEIVLKQALNDQLTHKAVGGDPLVRSIEGIGKSLYATLQLSNGNLIEAKVGDVLPNGMKVVSIRPNEVTVQSGNKQRTRLGGAHPAPVHGDFNPNYPGPGLDLPPLPVAAQRGAGR